MTMWQDERAALANTRNEHNTKNTQSSVRPGNVSQPAVEIRGLTKRIGHKTIVDNLSFEIPKGEVFGFLGPNGAGKTTTIRMMVGLISISKGQVVINGLDIQKNFREAMMHVGAIVENPEMYKFLSGYQNLVHFARMTPGVSKQRILEVVGMVGLEHRINDKVKTYSLGMRQRLGLAQALLHNPSVLILDEPTNGLDPAGIRELRDHLRKLARDEGLTVVVSSHLLSEMELMCDRVAVIQHGRLIGVNRMHDMTKTDVLAAQRTLFDVSQTDKALAIIERTLGPSRVPLHQESNSVDSSAIEISVTRKETSQVVAALVREGIEVYAVHVHARTLEESFLELTGDGDID
jgi:ABC-2 type transport system ATP-binding protein